MILPLLLLQAAGSTIGEPASNSRRGVLLALDECLQQAAAKARASDAAIQQRYIAYSRACPAEREAALRVFITSDSRFAPGDAMARHNGYQSSRERVDQRYEIWAARILDLKPPVH